MELALQKFLKKNPINWKEKLKNEPYNLSIHEKDDLVIFNYKIGADFSHDITKDARGLILEKNSWRIVRMAFRKFFNLGEKYSDQIDWKTASATSKEDGSIMSLYYYKNEWHVATNSCIDAADAMPHDPASPYNSYKEMFEIAAKNSGLNMDKLDPKNTYTFELVSPYNRIVVKYDTTKLFHILTRNNETLEELDDDIGVPKPKTYKCSNHKDYAELVEHLGSNKEGIVVKDAANNRVKMKTATYIKMHYNLIDSINTPIENIVHLIWNEETSEYLNYFPEKRDLINDIRAQLQTAEEKIASIKNTIKNGNWKTTREVYEYFIKNDKQFADMYVSAHKGQLDSMIDALKNCNRIQIERCLENYERIKEVIAKNDFATSKDALEWALEHDSKLSAAYPAIYNGTFDKYIRNLERSSCRMYLKKFNIEIKKGEKL